MRINSDIGVIFDTHGQVRPEALSALADCELILHVGVLHFNPGSAGPRRFSLPVTVGDSVSPTAAWKAISRNWMCPRRASDK